MVGGFLGVGHAGMGKVSPSHTSAHLKILGGWELWAEPWSILHS